MLLREEHRVMLHTLSLSWHKRRRGGKEGHSGRRGGPFAQPARWNATAALVYTGEADDVVKWSDTQGNTRTQQSTAKRGVAGGGGGSGARQHEDVDMWGTKEEGGFLKKKTRHQ